MSDITIGVAIIGGADHFEAAHELLPQLVKFDQVVFVDTTPTKIYRQYVTKLGKPFEYHSIKWRSSPYDKKGELIYGKNEWGFAYARNESWRRLKTTHGVWFDLDDKIGQIKDGKEFIASPAQAYGAFKKIATEAPEDVDVWFMNYVYSRDGNGNPNVFHARERMMKLSSGWHIVYPIHECWAPSQPPTHAMISDVQAIHYPRRTSDESVDRNMAMLQLWHQQLLDLNDTEDLPRCDLLIGDTYWGAEQYRECSNWLMTEFIRKYPNALDIEKFQAWGFIAKSQLELNNFEAARAAALAMIDIEPGLQDGYILLAQVKLVTEQDPQDILILIDTGARMDEAPPQVIKNPLDYTFTPYCIVSDCKYQLGQYDEALKWALKAQALSPNDPRTEHLRSQAAIKVRERDAIEASKALYQIYKDYDENEKAAKLYELLPYVVQKNETITEFAELAHHRVRHMFDREEYIKLYQNNTHWKPAEDEWIDGENPAGKERMQYILNRLKNALPNGGRVLDVGCSDGFHSLIYARNGYEVVGVDLDPRCVQIANERAEARQLPARFVHGFFEEMEPSKVADPFDPTQNWFHHFDAVICSEVIEHVQDPAFLVGCLVDCAKDRAPVIITTPDEAFDKGDTPEGGGMFEEDKELAGHVRVFTQETFEALLKSNPEVHVVESHFLPYGWAYREHQGWQVGEVRRMPRPEGPVIRVYCGDTVNFCPADLDTKGMGGSETAVVHMAKAWAAMGCQVVVYSGVNGIYDGVFYRTAQHYNPDHKSNVFISWRLPTVFMNLRPNADLTVLWCHDLYYPVNYDPRNPLHIPQEWVDRMDKIVVLSNFQKEFMEEVHPTLKGKLWVSRNGIDPSRFVNRNIEKVPHRYFYSSSYDRGLEELLEIWPEIKKAIPDAELHVAYGMESARMILKQLRDPAKLNKLENLVVQMKNMDGVTHHERLGQQELADLQLSCEAWLYPSQPNHENGMGGFLETYAITAVEAQAARAYPVTRINGALEETVKHHYEWKPSTTPEEIVHTLIWIHQNDIPIQKQIDANQKWALSQSWFTLALDWIKEFAPVEELVEVK